MDHLSQYPRYIYKQIIEGNALAGQLIIRYDQVRPNSVLVLNSAQHSDFWEQAFKDAPS